MTLSDQCQRFFIYERSVPGLHRNRSTINEAPNKAKKIKNIPLAINAALTVIPTKSVNPSKAGMIVIRKSVTVKWRTLSSSLYGMGGACSLFRLLLLMLPPIPASFEIWEQSRRTL